MPDLPTLQEQGVSGYECYTWNAILAPAKTPQPIVAVLSDAINKALADPVVLKRLQDAGVDPTPDSSPREARGFHQRRTREMGADHQGFGRAPGLSMRYFRICTRLE
jgi:tripartite-type tricarboxylate transporter receptor subunit TctC